MNVEAVIFDIGNVLIEWQPERHYDRVIGPERRKRMFAAVDLHGMNDLVDQGQNFTDTIYAWAEKYPEWRDEIRMWHDDWISLASPAIPHSVRLMRALRAQCVPVFALTNFGVQNFDYACTIYPFLNEFDRLYVSGRMKTVKPRAEIYERVEADCGIAAESLLFTDDRQDNIAAAQARGWQTHHFDGPDGLAHRLVTEGLLKESEAA
ncbi:HAD family hydrolase [Lutimaribacter marinistellae]|uniref:HAD family hydrolase n=1 Tax=Lutimaribacter marinistellae TaxID=1820329 RepID=A0ABV7TEI1_9RHOB